MITDNWTAVTLCQWKTEDKILLILDGQASVCGEIQMLEFAINSDILLCCLNPNSTKYFLNSARKFSVL
jgi:hypothetical protein